MYNYRFMTIENIDRVMSNLSYRPHRNRYTCIYATQPNDRKKIETPGVGSAVWFGTLQPPPP